MELSQPRPYGTEGIKFTESRVILNFVLIFLFFFHPLITHQNRFSLKFINCFSNRSCFFFPGKLLFYFYLTVISKFFYTGGVKPTHDFLSLYSHPTAHQDPRPSSQGIYFLFLIIPLLLEV